MVGQYIIPSDLLKMGSTPSPYPEIVIPNISPVYLRRNFLGRVVMVGTVPTLIHNAIKAQNIMFFNPARGPGAIGGFFDTHTFQINVMAAGNTNLFPTVVSNYLNMHLLLWIQLINAGSQWTFINQIQDPMTGGWVDSQVLVAAVTPAMVGTWTNAEFYALIGMFGVGMNYAIRWTLDAGAGPLTFMLSYILKDGTLPVVPQVVYIGSNNGVSITSGYPIIESTKEVYQVEEGTQIWGVAPVATNINILEL